MSDQPAIVLVHGAWGSPAMWDYVISALPPGHEVIVADLPSCSRPGTSLEDDAAHVEEIAGDRSVVLVGHSYGGAVITEAAARIPGARHLVYVAAAMPDAGESMFDWIIKRSTDQALPMELLDDGTTTITIDIDNSPYDAETLARLLRIGLRPFAISGATTALSAAAWRSLPTTYLVTTDDDVIHPDTQREMAERAGTVVEIEAHHQVQLSHPEDVAALIVGAMH